MPTSPETGTIGRAIAAMTQIKDEAVTAATQARYPDPNLQGQAVRVITDALRDDSLNAKTREGLCAIRNTIRQANVSKLTDTLKRVVLKLNDLTPSKRSERAA